jgi:transcription elongation factor Elf1
MNCGHRSFDTVYFAEIGETRDYKCNYCGEVTSVQLDKSMIQNQPCPVCNHDMANHNSDWPLDCGICGQACGRQQTDLQKAVDPYEGQSSEWLLNELQKQRNDNDFDRTYDLLKRLGYAPVIPPTIMERNWPLLSRAYLFGYADGVLRSQSL